MIKTVVKNKIGIIYLDIPEALNSLNCQMIEEIEDALKGFEKNPEIKAVLFDSEAERCFCAGGDLKEIYYDFLMDESRTKKDEFFKKEFNLNKYIMDYSKPIIAHWYGVTMGGGIGLTIHSDLIIADETVNWAMPETSLGFVPDVSVGYYISKLDQALGQYVGLIGSRLYPEDLVRNKLADILIDSKDYNLILDKLFSLDTSKDNFIEDFKKDIQIFAKNLGSSENTDNMEKIEKYFGKASLEEIVKVLEENQEDDFAREKLSILRQRDPFMTQVQFEKYFLGKKLTRKETIDLDLKIINYGLNSGEIAEGIRTVMIDKEDEPAWPVKSLSDVDKKEVENLLKIK